MTARYAFIHFPHFCHQQTKIDHHASTLVLVKEVHRALYVSDLSEHEYNLGIRLNMPLANAKAIVPDIIYYIHDDEYFRNKIMNLGFSALAFSPHVAIDDYGLIINISGCAHLFGGESNLLLAISAYFLKHGFHVQKAIAANPLLAKALAHFKKDTIVHGNSKNYLSHLPIDALFVDDAITRTFDGLGIVTIGALLKLPRKMLAQRFSINFIKRLDQLTGVLPVPLTYLEEKPQFIVTEDFLSPLRTHEHFIKEACNLLQRALAKICRNNFSLCSLDLVIKDSFKRIKRLVISSSRPNNDFTHWCNLFHLKTEKLRFIDGIYNIKIELTQFEKTKYLQKDFSEKSKSTIKRDDIIDKLKTCLSDRAVFYLRINEHHMPEYAVTKDFSLAEKSHACLKLPPRPLRLLQKPISVRVIAMIPDNSPAKIMWSHHTIDVVHARGPERIEQEWWNGMSEPYRDYFYIEDARGKRLWIYSSGESWFIHGIFT